MPLSISTEAKIEKNKLGSNDPWLLMLEIQYYTGGSPIRLVWNTEQVVWKSYTWYPASFVLGDQEESQDGAIPVVNLGVIDLERQLIPLVDFYDGGLGAIVNVFIVHSNYLNNATSEFEAQFEIIGVNIQHDGTITFKLGAEDLTSRRSHPHFFMAAYCRYNEFKGTLCGYSGGETDCDRTLTRCRELNNASRFGGFPGMGRMGIWM